MRAVTFALLVLLLLPPKCNARLRVVEGAAVAALVYEFHDNRFARLSRAADALEDRMPSVLHYNRWGDPVTWVHHAWWTAAAGAVLGLIGRALGNPFVCGFDDGSRLAVGFYGVRETAALLEDNGRGFWRDGRTREFYQRGPHLGRLPDGLGDFVFPLGVRFAFRGGL